MRSAEAVIDRLTRAALTVATAESCTGGALAAALVSVPGASAVFPGGIVSYAEKAKQTLLGVPAALIAEHGVVSPEVARAMAEGARVALSVDLAVATTGVAGPSGGTPETPVGTVCIAVSGERGTAMYTEHLSGDRDEVRRAAVEAALGRLLEYLDISGFL